MLSIPKFNRNQIENDSLWIEEYWWILVVAAVAVIAMIFSVLYFRSKSDKMIQVTVYSGTYEKTFSVKKGNPYNPQIPKREGYTFKGWYIDSACTVPWLSTYKVKKPLCLFADWQKD